MVFITVTHLKEIYWLQLQAKSMDLFLDENSVEEIIIVVNEEKFAEYITLFYEIVRICYGKHVTKLRIVPRSIVLDIPVDTHGWRSQQALKLAIIDTIENTEFAIILDTKNHFIKKINKEVFIHNDGRIKSCRVSHEGHMEKYFFESVKFFNLSPEKYIRNWTPTITPYCVYVSDVKECLSDLRNKQGKNFLTDFFIQWDCLITEFFLISAFIQKKYGSLDLRHNFHSLDYPNSVVVFADKIEDDGRFLSIMHQVEQENCISFALHHEVLFKLTYLHKTEITNLWRKIGLNISCIDIKNYFNLYCKIEKN